ncbi:hypothetical protein FKP32DRAFT_1676189 [Trametes sanguinea]|nr:hypothetical protein FKP32DRAFT_1676189 [Trametes sanguinea]
MSAPKRVGSNKDTVERPNATSALGFLTRGIRSVSSLVTHISTIFSSSSQDAPQSSPVESDDELVLSGQTPETDGSQNTHGSSPEASSSQEDSEDSSTFGPIVSTTAATPAPRRTEVVYPRIVRTPTRRLARVSGPSTSNTALVPATSVAVAGPSSLSRAPLRREGAFYGLSSAPQVPAIQAPRPRGQLRREPVYIEGQDPDSVTPAGELRGRDPRTIRENRYWLDSWGRLPTLEEIVPRGVPDARMVISYLHRRYGQGTEPFWQAVDYLFPLPDGEEYRPRFERIVRTSEWRNQSEDWVGGIEPVGRVREPARADDAADSEAEMESVGYVSDDDVTVSEGPATSAVPASTSPSFGSSSASPSSSALAIAGPSTQRKRTRESDSDAENPTASNGDDRGRPTNRRRLSPPPPSPARSPSTSRRRQAPRTHRRGASFTYPESRPAQTRVARPPRPPPPPAPPSPSPPPALGLPTIVYTPASPCPSVTIPSPRMPSAAVDPSASGSSSSSGSSAEASSSSSATQFLAPPSPHRPRRSPRHRRSSPAPSPQLAGPASPATRRAEEAPAASSSSHAVQAPAPSGSRGRSTDVARSRKRRRDEAQEDEASARGGEERSPDSEDARKERKRPRRER